MQEDSILNKSLIKELTEWMKLFLELGGPFGAIIILWYCLNIGYFPQGLTLGDTLYFIIVSFMFAFVFAFITLILFSVGKLLFHPAAFVVNKMAKNKLVHTRLLLGQVCAIFTVPPTFVFSICGIGLIIDFWSIKGLDAIWVGATAIFLAYFVGEYLINSQKLLDTNLRLENYVEVSGGDKRIDIEKNVKNIKIQKIIYGSSIIIWPIVLGGMSESFLNGAIGLSHLRVNVATVHIKQPYCEIAKQYFSTQYIQANDEKFCKLTNMAVLFHGIGTNSLIADINNQDNYLSIPSKEIVIKPTTFKVFQPTAKSGG